jgi:hypothetical protein
MANVRCMNAAGQLVKVAFNQVGLDDMYQYSLDVVNLSAGVYTIEFIGTDGMSAKAKLIK